MQKPIGNVKIDSNLKIPLLLIVSGFLVICLSLFVKEQNSEDKAWLHNIANTLFVAAISVVAPGTSSVSGKLNNTESPPQEEVSIESNPINEKTDQQ